MPTPMTVQENNAQALENAIETWRLIRAGNFEAWQGFSDLCSAANRGEKQSKIMLELMMYAAAITSGRGEA